MKSGSLFRRLVLAAMAAGVAASALGASTDGNVTFIVQTAAYSGNYNPNNVAVVWVVDSSNKFIKTLCRHAGTRIGYLSRWSTSRGSYTNVDGTTSATLTSQPQTHTVTWNCRNTNNAVVPDGMYYFKVEYTSDNGDGPYTTNGMGFLKGTANVSTNFANYSSAGGQFNNMSLTYTPVLPDVAVTGLSPAAGLINVTIPVGVAVSNRTGTATPSFDVSLSNLTAGVQIGMQTIPVLAGNAATNVIFNWNTAGLTAGVYALKAQLTGLPGETNLANNFLTNLVTLNEGLHDVAVNAITVGAVVPPGVTTNVAVTVSNAGNYAESFALVLSNLTSVQTIGNRSVAGLVAGASSNVVFSWSTTNAIIGFHTLQASANVVAGEMLTANNVRQLAVAVAHGLETNTLIARGAPWKYLDEGLDISGAPWTLPASGYYDGFWASGSAPFGFGTAGIATPLGTAPTVIPGTVPATDAASNTIYAANWTNGMNGGFGFGAWQLSAGASGGHFTWTSTANAGGGGGIDTGGRAWGLWSSSGVTEAVRPLTGGLATGQVFRVAFDNGWVANGKSAGLGIRNAAGANLWEFFVTGSGGGGTTTNLAENFAGFTTTSGTTDRASSLDSYLQTPGWTGSRVYEDNGRAKIGTASAQGWLTTPVVNLSGNGGAATLTFELGQYRTDVGLVQVLHAADGSAFAPVGSDLTPPASMTLQTVQITGGTAASKIRIAAKNAANNRFNVDHVILTQAGAGAAGIYYVNDRRGPTATPIPFTGGGLQIAFQRTGPTNYSADVTSGSNSWNFTESLIAQADPVPAQLRCWNWEAGNGSNYDVFINSLSVSNATTVIPATNAITTYFRKEFTLDAIPLAVSGQIRRADGVVIYLNGWPLDQQNMPVGTVLNAATLATAAVTAGEAASYLLFNVAPSNLVTGRNWLAAELHLSSPVALRKVFDLELQALQNAVPKSYNLLPTAIQADGAIQYGDQAGATVALTNSGNVASACTVMIRDAASSTILASQAVPAMAAGEASSVHLAWPTLGLPAGGRVLQVGTVVNGTTNWSVTVSNTLNIAVQNFSPRRVNASNSIGGPCRAVAVSGSTVYLGQGSTLEIWDVLNPASPRKTGALRLPGLIADIAADSTTVCVAAGASGVHVVDVTSPTPMQVATFDTSGNANRLALAGSTLFIADGKGGVRSLDISDPAAPVLTGAYATPGAARAVLAAAPNLMVLDSDNGLQVITTGATPGLVSEERRITAGSGLAGASGAVFVCDENGGLFRIDTADPAAPAIVASALLPAIGRELAASGSALYIAAGPAGILTANPATLALVATNTATGEASDAVLSGHILYVAAGFGGCQMWDVSSPTAPVWLGSFGQPLRAVDADLSTGALFVAGDEAGLQVHSLTNPAAPQWMTTVATATNPRCLAVAGSQAFVGEAGGELKIYSITNPFAPVLLGSAPANGLATVRRLAVSGPRLVMTDGHRINLLDVSVPSAPAPVASNLPPGYVFDLAASTSRIYAACGGGGLRILDLATLGAVGSYSTAPEPVVSLSVDEPYVHLGAGRSLVMTLDVSNPAAPVPVQSTAAPGFGLAAAGATVYGVDGLRRGRGLDMSVPLTPVSALSLSNLTFALRVRAQGQVVLAAEDEAGLSIFQTGAADINHNGIPDPVDQQIVDADPSDAIQTIWDVKPDDDFDHDGASNLAEVLAGTSPVDPGSVFAISSGQPAASEGGGQFVIRWYSVNGKTYTIQKSTNLISGFSALQAGLPADPPVNSYTDTVSTVATYYLISVP